MATETHIMDDNTPFVEAEVVEYSSVSVWAVLALLLAIVSPLAFINPLLMVLPLASCFLAVVAGLKIRSSSGTRSGASLARWAAALAMICMVAAPARTALRDYLLLKQADKTAQHWLWLISEDRMAEAVRGLDLSALEKLAGPPAPGTTQQRLTLQQLVVLLQNDPLINQLVAMQKDSDSKKNQITFIAKAPLRGWSIQVVYEVSNPSRDKKSAKPYRIVLDLKKQSLFEGQNALWLITNWAELTEEAP